MKFSIFFSLFLISTVSCSDPWGWQTPSISYKFDNSHGIENGFGHDDKNVYDKGHVNKYDHENAHESGTSTGYVKGTKTDWANYQYGGEGSRVEGDQFEKNYGTSFGQGHDVGHSSGQHQNHKRADGHNNDHKNGWEYSPHYASASSSEISEHGHDPW